MKLVLDTNVLVSGLIFPGGTPGRIVRAWVEVPRDPGDAPILATLAATKADVLVTGDGDLLALRDKHPIETPAEFIRRL